MKTRPYLSEVAHVDCSAAWLFLLTLLGICRVQAATWQEDFGDDPLAHGWQIFGDGALMHWNATNQNLEVTWDSSETNTYIYRPLGTILSREDSFRLAFDLRLHDVAVGVNPDKEFTFELALGFIHLASATRPDWRRGAGSNPTYGPRNLVEFDYFPDSGYGATISPTIVSSNNQFATVFAHPFELDVGALFHVEMSYDAARRTLSTSMTRGGLFFGPIQDTVLATNFTDFRCDALAIASYSDAGAGGSILAHGVVDNVAVTLPEPPLTTLTCGFTNQLWQVQFACRSNWLYTLERSTDFQSWALVPPAQPGNGGVMVLVDAISPGGPAPFYRVRAEKP